MNGWISFCFRMLHKYYRKGQIFLGTFLGKVVAFVLLMHALALAAMLFCPTEIVQNRTGRAKKQVVVRPVALSSPPKIAAAPLERKQQAHAPKREKVLVKKDTPTKRKQEPVSSKKKNIASAKESVREKLASAKGAINRKEQAPMTKNTTSSLKLQTPFFIPAAYRSPEELIGDKLHTLLTLPEYGSVQLELTLSAQGEVEKVVIKEADSEKNRQYVEESLKRIQFSEASSLLENKGQTLNFLLVSE